MVSVIGSTSCQSPSVLLAKCPRQCCFLFLFFLYCCVSFFFLFCSAEGPSPVVNKKISFNISCLSHLQVIEFDDGSGSVLRIQPLRTPRDEAIYECVASNSVGETSATTRLTVLRGRSPLGSPEKKRKSHPPPSYTHTLLQH